VPRWIDASSVQLLSSGGIRFPTRDHLEAVAYALANSAPEGGVAFHSDARRAASQPRRKSPRLPLAL